MAHPLAPLLPLGRPGHGALAPAHLPPAFSCSWYTYPSMQSLSSLFSSFFSHPPSSPPLISVPRQGLPFLIRSIFFSSPLPAPPRCSLLGNVASSSSPAVLAAVTASGTSQSNTRPFPAGFLSPSTPLFLLFKAAASRICAGLVRVQKKTIPHRSQRLLDGTTLPSLSPTMPPPNGGGWTPRGPSVVSAACKLDTLVDCVRSAPPFQMDCAF